MCWVWSLESQILSLESEAWSLESGVWSLKSGVWSLKPGVFAGRGSTGESVRGEVPCHQAQVNSAHLMDQGCRQAHCHTSTLLQC